MHIFRPNRISCIDRLLSGLSKIGGDKEEVIRSKMLLRYSMNRFLVYWFVCRYKIITPETWPEWHGTVTNGIKHLMQSVNMEMDQWQMGKTKVFIKNPESVRKIKMYCIFKLLVRTYHLFDFRVKQRFFNPLGASPTKWSNTLKQFVACCQQIVWVCLTILWGWHLEV